MHGNHLQRDSGAVGGGGDWGRDTRAEVGFGSRRTTEWRADVRTNRQKLWPSVYLSSTVREAQAGLIFLTK